MKNVSVVFHVAATVKLTGSLKLALELNVLGTVRIDHLCKRIEKLEVSIFSQLVINSSLTLLLIHLQQLAFSRNYSYDKENEGIEILRIKNKHLNS